MTAAKEIENTPTAPLLSILCITYNHERYISTAINSFLEQETLFDFEIVIGDDCSTDRTLEIILEIQKSHSRIIRIIKSETNLGITENFRRTLAACRGKYIALCEGDDYWNDPRKIQTQVSFLENNPCYILTYHDSHSTDDNGLIFNDPSKKGVNYDITKSKLIKGIPISTLTVCFRNKLNSIPKEFNSAPILDICLWSLLGHHGAGKYLSAIRPAVYRLHNGGVFSSKSKNEKLRMTAETYITLSRYYENNREKEIGEFFNIKAIGILSMQIKTTNRLKAIVLIIFRILKMKFIT